MNILMVSPFIPFPPNSGGNARVFNILNQLRRHHHVTFVAPAFGRQVFPPGIDDHIINLPAHSTLYRIFSLVSWRPYHANMVKHKRINEYVRHLINRDRYDLVYLHYVYSAQYVSDEIGIPVVLDPQNVDREVWFHKARNHGNPPLIRLFSLINAYKTIHFEEEKLKKIQAYVSVSEQDRQNTEKFAAPCVKRFIVAPNAVNTTIFTQKPFNETPVRQITLGFLGSMDLSVNQLAAKELCLEILPLVRQKLVGWNISVILVGKNPPGNIAAIGKRDRSIRITGTVPDVVHYIHQMDMMILPLKEGGGTKLRVLEGMAAGLPIIGTSFAFMGIDGLRNGRNCFCADGHKDIVEIIASLALDPQKRRFVGLNARQLAVKYYDWEAVVNKLSKDLLALATSVN